MKHLTIILLFLSGCMPAVAQSKTDTTSRDSLFKNVKWGHTLSIGNLDSANTITSSLIYNNSIIADKADTVAVIAYCLDTKILKTQWRRLYATHSTYNPCYNFNGLLIYPEYLMPDRKTKSIYKVIYCINP